MQIGQKACSKPGDS